jgi:hypothetical protein
MKPAVLVEISDLEKIIDERVQKAFYSVAKQYPTLDILVYSMEWIDDCGDKCDDLCLDVKFRPKGWEQDCFEICNDKLEAVLREKIELAIWDVVKDYPDKRIFINVYDYITRTGIDCKDLACYLECEEKVKDE